jgi:ATP-dependent DNA helicase RecQ
MDRKLVTHASLVPVSGQERIRRAAREVFGFEELRPGQAEAVERVLAGCDTLAVMSTGYGKSAIYQIAALLIPGPTVVVSPLIALQSDQVTELEREGAGGAAAVSSYVGEGERREALEELSEGSLEFLFLSPEQLANEEVLAEVADAGPSLFVVDEAHLISEWGHDFRPDYLHLGAVAEAIGRPPILALTATAAPPVRAEILERLGMRSPEVIVRGFDRPNIRFAVERFHDAHAKRRALISQVADEPKPGIVYAATRRLAEELGAELVEAGVSATVYHGGMGRAARTSAQEAFMEDTVDVVVATTAFGMGVDKPNVRFVFHSEPSDSVDSYYQEVGRAGRDGSAARAVLFYRAEDLGLRRFFAGGAHDESRLELERSRVTMMGEYADSRGCRREFVLTYFGEQFTPPCGRCDNCEAGLVSAPTEASRPFPEGTRVRHPQWADGVVQRYEGAAVVVLFDSVGYKKLGLDMVLERGLLCSVDALPR